ncbi:hypothetical protein [Kitasatospora mediocidica]|uniref:hypothetical protein n=1 Tax=Kitasatospora mediocidica TaxID=58352 RepID=UPI00056653DA|nr:hypothetical protein [Kitasatospora mediocidica]
MDSSTDDARRTPRPGSALRRLVLVGTTALALLATAAPIATAAPTAAPSGSTAGSGTTAGTTTGSGTAAPHDQPPAAVPPAPTRPGTFVRTDLTRLLDTRSATGVPTAAPLGAGADLSFALGLPAADVKAVVLNVTATDTTADGFLTVYPDGAQQPSTSNLNFTAGQTIANLVTVPVTDGKVAIHNRFGSVDVIADMSGYYTDDAALSGSTYLPVTPGRVLDTRDGTGTGGRAAPVGQFGTVNLPVAGHGGVPKYGATSVVLNVTATDTTDTGFLTVYPHGTARPGTSNLNFAARQTVPNLVTVPLGADGSVDIYNHLGTTDVVADVFGFYTSAPTGSGYTATGPTRLFDTREAGGQKVGPGQTLSRPVGQGSGLSSTKVSAVVLNVTATNPTSDGFVTVFTGANSTPPGTSNLNFTTGRTVPNLVIVPVDDSGMLNFYNRFGSVDLVVDLFGYFTAPQGGPTGLAMGGYNGAPTCNQASPGGWVDPQFVSGTVKAVGLTLSGTGFANSAHQNQIWAEIVITGPDGTTSYPTQPNYYYGTPVPLAASYTDFKAQGQYSWYAYTTDGTLVSPPSAPCYFQVGPEPGLTGVTITSTSTQFHVGAPAQFTFTSVGNGTLPGQQAGSFCYGFDPYNCTTVPAVNGAATVTITPGQWGSQFLSVKATSLDGGTTAANSFQMYVASN